MDNGGTHVVVAMRCAVGMLVLSKFDDMDIAAVMRLTRTVKACGSFSWVGLLGSLPLPTCAVQ
jgi:hypothetical protein